MTYQEFTTRVETLPVSDYVAVAEFCKQYPEYAQMWFTRMSEQFMQSTHQRILKKYALAYFSNSHVLGNTHSNNAVGVCFCSVDKNQFKESIDPRSNDPIILIVQPSIITKKIKYG